MNKYELAILFHPDLEVDLSKAEAKIKKLIADNKGKITATDNWGKRKLAYPIANNEHAIYVFYQIELQKESVQNLEKILNITDEIIRYLIVRDNPKQREKIEQAKKDALEQQSSVKSSEVDQDRNNTREE